MLCFGAVRFGMERQARCGKVGSGLAGFGRHGKLGFAMLEMGMDWQAILKGE